MGTEWAREWGRWCAATRAAGAIAQQYAAIPLEGWGPQGTWRPAGNRALCAWARSASYFFGGPRQGCRWRVSLTSVPGCMRCGGLVCADLVTGFPYRPSSDRKLGRSTRAVLCGRRHRPIGVGGRHARVPCLCVCACVRILQVGQVK